MPAGSSLLQIDAFVVWKQCITAISEMKKILSLLAVTVFTMLFQACEKQNWEETKMFHDVPKRGEATHEKTEAHPAPAAKEVEKPQ